MVQFYKKDGLKEIAVYPLKGAKDS